MTHKNSYPFHFLVSLTILIILLECYEKLNSRFALEQQVLGRISKYHCRNSGSLQHVE